jgi:hypothetical protein
VIPDSLPIAGHRQYVITRTGHLYKVWGFVKSPGVPLSSTRSVPNRPLAKDAPWYMYVSLLTADYVLPGGDIVDVPTFKRLAVHRLVCASFHGTQPDGKPWVNHKDGVKDNNDADNLEWSSISENIQHAVDTGLRKRITGSDHWNHGKTFSADTKALMAAAKLGENHPKFKGWYCHGGVRYASTEAASVATGVSKSSCRVYAFSGKKGWSFEKKSESVSSIPLPDQAVTFQSNTNIY